jgi:hypothetical protein
MKQIIQSFAKPALGTAAAGAMALATASPAMADDHRDRGGIDAGDVIAGAVIIGGIAALAGAFDNDRDDWRDRRDRRWRDRDWRHRDRNWRDRRGWRGDRRGWRGGRRGPEFAINACVRAAENQARRFGGWRFADVTEIRDVDRRRYGFRIRGRIVVEDNVRFRRNFDRGRFTCRFDGRGRPRLDFDSVRGLR